jgi:hypothetical protein
MANYQEQELSLQLCIIAIMQKEELSDSRNRQAAENDRRQNEDQICLAAQTTARWTTSQRSLQLRQRAPNTQPTAFIPRMAVAAQSSSSPPSRRVLRCHLLPPLCLLAGWQGGSLI